MVELLIDSEGLASVTERGRSATAGLLRDFTPSANVHKMCRLKSHTEPSSLYVRSQQELWAFLPRTGHKSWLM